MTVDSSGTAHVLYSCSGETNQRLMYSRLPYGGSWTAPKQLNQTPENSSYIHAVYDSLSIATDRNNGPFAAYTVFDDIQYQRVLYAALPDENVLALEITDGIFGNAVAFCDKDLMGLLFTHDDPEKGMQVKYRLYSSPEEFTESVLTDAAAKVLGFSNENKTFISFVNMQNVLSAGVMEPGYQLSGLIKQGLAPISGAWVTVTNGVSTFTVQTDSNGYYFVYGLGNSIYTVTPFMQGKTFSPVQSQVSVSSATPPTVTVAAVAPFRVATTATVLSV